MISPERAEALQTGWVRLLGGYGVGPADAYPVFDALIADHSQPHRHYHTLTHIGEMLRVAGRLADVSNDPAAVQLAVWFHDCVCDPRAKNNEERSAERMAGLLAPLNLPAELIDRVARMIRATAHTGDPADDPDTLVLLDADLSILSAEEWRYVRYADAIRLEYDWVDDEAYRAGRTAVLQAFLSRPQIYRTERFRSLGEEPARRNLAWEIARLAGADPSR